MSSVVIAGDTSGSVTLSAPSVAGTTTLTLPSTSGTVVTTNTMPTGSVLQVVNTAYSTGVSSATSTYVDTGVTASITPSSTSNKILITVQINGTAKQGANVNLRTRLNRGGTTILYIDSLAGNDQSTAFLSPGTVGTTYLDSPSTTSAITYTVQISNISSSGSVAINDAAGGTVSTSTITLMEIKG